jgi:hypothetical protein
MTMAPTMMAATEMKSRFRSSVRCPVNDIPVARAEGVGRPGRSMAGRWRAMRAVVHAGTTALVL